MQISAPLDHGSSGSPVFNAWGLVIGIVSEKLESSAELNFALSSNAMYEALAMTNAADHPTGFELGITNGLEMRNQAEIDADNAATIKKTSDWAHHDDDGRAKVNAATDAQNVQAAAGGPGIWPKGEITLGNPYTVYCDPDPTRDGAVTVIATFKGSVEGYSDLPTDNAKEGDCWFSAAGYADHPSGFQPLYFVQAKCGWNVVRGMTELKAS
jgi:hypothetical protein